MDQRYLETVRCCKTLLRNLDYLDENITYGQRDELSRLFQKVQQALGGFLISEEMDEGLWVGEE